MQLEVARNLSYMLIVCEFCEAAYQVEDRLLRPGRATKCARCGHRWVPLAAEAPADPAPPPEPPPLEHKPEAVVVVPTGPTAMDRLGAASAAPRAELGLRLAWAASVLVLLLLIVGLYVGRNGIMGAWPPSIRLYSLFRVAPAAETPHRGPETKPEGVSHDAETGQHPAD